MRLHAVGLRQLLLVAIALLPFHMVEQLMFGLDERARGGSSGKRCSLPDHGFASLACNDVPIRTGAPV